MKEKKIIKYALSMLLADSAQGAADLGMSEDQVKELVKEIKRDFVLVPVDDPGLRMVEQEITL